MYEEKEVTYKVGINWKDIIIKVILLVLFILLLIWLFPKPDMEVLYNNVYSNNINAMKEAAEKYYVGDRLPSTVGESSSMTLQQMIDDKMIIQFKDKHKNYCDQNTSGVKVTKTADNQYVLKVELNCGKDEKDYILETLTANGTGTSSNTVATTNNGSRTNNNGNSNGNGNGTNENGSNNGSNNGSGNGSYSDSHADDSKYTGDSKNPGYSDDDEYSEYTSVKDADMGIRTTQVLYYQHRKAVYTTKSVYTCPAGYTLTGNRCYRRTTGATIDATPVYSEDVTVVTPAKYNTGAEHVVYTDVIKTKIGTEYSCPDGYTKNGAYCVKYTDATVTHGQTTYTCESGYTLNGTKCTKTYTATYTPGASSYTCPQGGTLSGKNCILTTAATENVSYTCPSGYTRNGTSCYKVYDATSQASYSCPSGYTLSGKKCTKTNTDYAELSVTYTCPSGYTRDGSKCHKSSTSTIDATASVSYSDWKNAGTQYKTSSGAAYTGELSKLVLNGAISGAACGAPCGNKGIWYKYIYYTRTKSTNYSCPSGYTRDGSKCHKTTTSTIDATPSYSCPSGYTRDGNRCVRTTTSTIDATEKITYTCPQGGTLNGSKCTITTQAEKHVSYTCPSGYTLDNSTKKCNKTYAATEQPGTGSYTCPQGGTLNGTKCTITKDATAHTGQDTYSCPSGYTLNSSTKKCEKKIDATATDIYKYTCPEGYTATGTGENTKCYKLVREPGTYYCEDADAKLVGEKCYKVKKGELTGYSCPAGYTKQFDKCYKITDEFIDATLNTQTYTSYQYTWSKYSYLEGWEFTGNTKTVTQTYTAGQK